MATAVPSRFACLKIDDDEEVASPKPKNIQKTKPLKKNKIAAKQSQSNGTASTSSKKKKKPVEANTQQWEQWKKKDSEMVNGNFEDDMEQAILLSKLEYEKKKLAEKKIRKQPEKEKVIVTEPGKGKQQGKQKQKKTMSLDQFKDLLAGNTSDVPDSSVLDSDIVSKELSEEPPADTTFFSRVISDTQAEIEKNKHQDLFKQRGQLSEADLLRARIRELIEQRNAEIEAFKRETQAMNVELGKVRCRNKQLCFILGQSEMRDKAELVQEVERIRGEQQDSVAEVARLHKELEKERTYHTETKLQLHQKTSKHKIDKDKDK